jgi:hypothetical protein
MRKAFFPLLVFVGGALVGPLLYWVMPLLPRYDLFYYGVGPLIWPVQLIGPLMDFLGTSNDALLVGLNVLLYAIVGMGIVAAARNTLLFFFSGAVLGAGVIILALSAVHFRIRDLIGHDGTMLIALLIALAFYGSLVFFVRLIAIRLQPR